MEFLLILLSLFAVLVTPAMLGTIIYQLIKLNKQLEK